MLQFVQPDASKQIGGADTLSMIRKLQGEKIPLHIRMNNTKSQIGPEMFKSAVICQNRYLAKVWPSWPCRLSK